MKYLSLIVISILVLSTAICPRPEAHGEDRRPLNLDETIALALARSNSIQMAREGVKEAAAQRKEALTAFLPKLSTSYSYTRLDKTPAFNLPGSPPLIPPSTVVTGTTDNYNWALEARQPLFAGGGIKANYDAARLGLEAARLEEETVRLNIAYEAKVAYFNALKARRIAEVARQTRQQLQAHLNVARNFFSVGLIPKNDLLLAEVEAAGGDQFHLRAGHALDLARARFNTLLRREIETPVNLTEVPEPEDLDRTLEDCLKSAFENRPELKVRELRTRQARSLTSLARSELYPAVSVAGNYSRFGDDLGVSGSNYRNRESWQVTALANWNFWEWGRSLHRIEQQTARERQSLSSLNNLKDQIVLEVKSAYLEQDEAKKQLAVSRQAITRAEENLRINKERYAEQVATSTEVLDAQTLLTRVTSDYHNALGDYQISRARLTRAMGQ